MTIASTGAALFGLVIGWITYRTLARNTEKVQLSDIATVIGAVGGAAVVALFEKGEMFGWYSIGLAAGFFLYLIVWAIIKKGDIEPIMGRDDPAIMN